MENSPAQVHMHKWPLWAMPGLAPLAGAADEEPQALKQGSALPSEGAGSGHPSIESRTSRRHLHMYPDIL